MLAGPPQSAGLTCSSRNLCKVALATLLSSSILLAHASPAPLDDRALAIDSQPLDERSFDTFSGEGGELDERGVAGEEDCDDPSRPATVYVTVTVDGGNGQGGGSGSASTTLGGAASQSGGAGEHPANTAGGAAQTPAPPGGAAGGGSPGTGGSSVYDDGSCKTGCGGVSGTAGAGAGSGSGAGSGGLASPTPSGGSAATPVAPVATPSPSSSDWEDQWGDDGGASSSSGSSGSASGTATGTAGIGGDGDFSAGFRSASPVLLSLAACLFTSLFAGIAFAM